MQSSGCIDVKGPLKKADGGRGLVLVEHLHLGRWAKCWEEMSGFSLQKSLNPSPKEPTKPAFFKTPSELAIFRLSVARSKSNCSCFPDWRRRRMLCEIHSQAGFHTLLYIIELNITLSSLHKLTAMARDTVLFWNGQSSFFIAVKHKGGKHPAFLVDSVAQNSLNPWRQRLKRGNPCQLLLSLLLYLL